MQDISEPLSVDYFGEHKHCSALHCNKSGIKCCQTLLSMIYAGVGECAQPNSGKDEKKYFKKAASSGGLDLEETRAPHNAPLDYASLLCITRYLLSPLSTWSTIA